MDRSNVLRSSYVFNNTPNSGANRNFISTSLVGDSFAYNDDLRKYDYKYLDLLSKIYLTIRRLT